MNVLKSWVNIPVDSDFTIYNIPFGIFTAEGITPRVCTAIGDSVLDIAYLADKGYLPMLEGEPKNVLKSSYLNDFMALGKSITKAVRLRLMELLSDDNNELKGHIQDRENAFFLKEEVTMLLPIEVKNYTDFYSSKEHATNVGTMFRDPDNALLPNWKHIPVGYHGRASSIILSGTPIHRPKGQTLPNGETQPVFGPCKLLDFELEMAFVTCKGNTLGTSISVEEAEDHIFGMLLFNDWSARDIQKWEYVPLGPFLAKNFASSISPWVVTLEALEPFKIAGPKQDPKVLPYLEYLGNKNYDIQLTVCLQTATGTEKQICKSNFKYMYWNMCQQLAHHTVNGCNVMVGDIYGSGTISGPTPDSYGSMLEITWKGTKPINMPDGSTRKFINDGDTVIMKGHAKINDIRVGFGEVSTEVFPSV
ncbi:fumarylacetoacetase [Neptunitalea chrysea]|uniref:fumarylacetoacetase n=1 Tax=Neptunitalea chrysea TaxID=1647581 RepID=A0A9W6B492_9FLAO|nr:fumarylacetoacetase [Neptunitalea chrysea]GLB51315.1 fumarylacetoacetase [Neptunitalea chrysea]